MVNPRAAVVWFAHWHRQWRRSPRRRSITSSTGAIDRQMARTPRRPPRDGSRRSPALVFAGVLCLGADDDANGCPSGRCAAVLFASCHVPCGAKAKSHTHVRLRGIYTGGSNTRRPKTRNRRRAARAPPYFGWWPDLTPSMFMHWCCSIS